MNTEIKFLQKDFSKLQLKNIKLRMKIKQLQEEYQSQLETLKNKLQTCEDEKSMWFKYYIQLKEKAESEQINRCEETRKLIP